MTEILNQVLKWVFVVFVAAFIGYFGKLLAEFLISKFTKNKKEKSESVSEKIELKRIEANIEKAKLKAQMKKAKRLAKAKKKSRK